MREKDNMIKSVDEKYIIGRGQGPQKQDIKGNASEEQPGGMEVGRESRELWCVRTWALESTDVGSKLIS